MSNPATIRKPKGKKPRKKRNGINRAAAFDKEETDMLKQLKKASGDLLTISEIQRAAVRFAVPKFLSGEVPINDRITLTPAKPAAAAPA